MADPVYATSEEFYDHTLPSEAFADVDSTLVDKALSWASRRADNYLRKRYILPLASWSEDLKSLVCDIAAYKLLSRRGFDPEQQQNQAIKQAYLDAWTALEALSTGEQELASAVDSSASPQDEPAQPLSVSDAKTDWQWMTRSNPNSNGEGCCG